MTDFPSDDATAMPGEPAASGRAASTAPVPPGKLFTMAGVGWAAFLGSPLAGGILLAANARRLGNRALAQRQILATALVTLVSIVLYAGVNIPEAAAVPPVLVHAVVIAGLAGTIVYARHTQRAAVDAHRAAGGALQSNWRAAGIGLLTLLGVWLSIAVVVVALGVAGVLNFNNDLQLVRNYPAPAELRLPAGWRVANQPENRGEASYRIRRFRFGLISAGIDFVIGDKSDDALSSFCDGWDDPVKEAGGAIESPRAPNGTLAGRPAQMCEHKEALNDAIVHQAVVATSGNTKTCALIYTAREENYARYLPEFAQVRDSLRCP
ncbi:hypothetical protein NTJ56_20135 [Burkholderia contaminans]|uniref:hypothetical protein n=1 Tax=Burkholderia contaminans TaxID=488447 RepID=UPI001CF5F16F|nr:hypothetical protein [Burkholderia contaminans]MCA7915849.1 hypothetical protein [Burkholderia contaminans]UUX40753.1 hypothetical protein NTJ56_20135 [Burkholderia contaminans]